MAALIIIGLLVACQSDIPPDAESSEKIGQTAQSTETDAAGVLTDTALYSEDNQLSIESSLLVQIDFEDEFPPVIYDGDLWYMETESNGNVVLCNRISDDWSSFQFGLEAWENYAVSLKMKFQSPDESQSAEMYFRINSSVQGYRAYIENSGWAEMGYSPPDESLGGKSIPSFRDDWLQVEVRLVEEQIELFINDETIMKVEDSTRMNGMAGLGASPDTVVCVDDILVKSLDENGNPVESPPGLIVKTYDGQGYTINEKVENRPSIPVFFPWPESFEDRTCGQSSGFYFDCDSPETPYSLVWIASGRTKEVDSTAPQLSPAQRILMQSDKNTLYLVSDEWHYWNTGWEVLSPDSKFYLSEIYEYHEGSEYGRTLMIHFEHPEWPELMAEKAFAYQKAGFDGLMLDWWGNEAGNGRPEKDVETARVAIAKALREKVGNDFILLGNVNWNMNDPTAQYFSGAFLELWKPTVDEGYLITQENESAWSFQSIERMEDLLIYWDSNLLWPKIIAFEPWKITTKDYVDDRYSKENIAYAKLFTAMAVVIPENGYILYADNNDDWDGGDHQHAYYDFYHIDLGRPVSGMIVVAEGVAYKQFERGLIAYNRTSISSEIDLPGGKQIQIGSLEGIFLEN